MIRSFVLLAICSVVTSQNSQHSQQEIDISAGISDFASKFYKKCAESTNGNIIVSPYSLAITLSLLYQGAQGTTESQLKEGLGLPHGVEKAEVAELMRNFMGGVEDGKGPSIFTVSNNIFVRQGDSLNPSFLSVAKNEYQSDVQPVNFADREGTAHEINQFIAQKTKNLITNLVTPDTFSGDSRLFFANAIFFKGAWSLPFQPNLTQLANFNNGDKTVSSVPFMHAEKDYFYSFFRELNASMLELKYLNSQFSLLILLPNVHTKLQDLEENIANSHNFSLANCVSRLVYDEVEVDIPRFNIEYEVKAKDILTKMNMDQMFSRHAKLSGILTTTEYLKVSEIVHKAVIEVNEKGSKAAAATGVGIVNYSFPPRFRADRPFLFFIWDRNTKTPIFSGRVKNIPSASL